MSIYKMFMFIFLVGFLSLTSLVLTAKAAVGTLSSPVTTVTTTANILFTFATSSNDSSITFSFSSSTDGVTWSPSTTVATSTGRSFLFTRLATNTLYYLRVAEGDATASSTYVTTSIYTWAAEPGLSTISGINAQGFTVAINSSTNPPNTTYIIRDSYNACCVSYIYNLQNGGTWSTTAASFTYAQLGGLSGTTTMGLATNTSNNIDVAAVNGNGVTSSYGSVNLLYTLAATPASPTITSAVPTQLTVVINPGSNNTTTETTFVVRDTVSSTRTKYLQSNSTWGDATTTFTYAQLGGLNGTTTLGLATSTQHIISVAAVNGNSVATTSYSTATNVYTVGATPGVSVISATSTTSFTVTINSSTNPTSTIYIVRDTGSSTTYYLQDGGVWGVATATFNYLQLGGLSGTSTIGLSANTLHIIGVAAVSADGSATSSYSTTVSVYTLASTPSSLSVSGGGDSLTFSWSGDSTQYYASDDTSGTNSGLTSSTSYLVSGLSCGTTHSFTVSGRNGDGVVTATSTSASGSTSGCGGSSSGGGGGGGGIVAVVPPRVVSTTIISTPVVRTNPLITVPTTEQKKVAAVLKIDDLLKKVKQGQTNNQVLELQTQLKSLGYFDKNFKPTKTYGSATAIAVKKYLADKNKKPAVAVPKPQPIPAVALLDKLIKSTKYGQKGFAVKEMQTELKKLKFFPVDFVPNGVYGPATRSAVAKYRASKK